jgi:hypothetical protein
MGHISREKPTTKRNANDKSTMATASDPDIYINITQSHIYFCTWFYYTLLKPCAKGNTVHLPYRQENGLQADSGQSIFGDL